jgi:recombinational DNA repair protein (RecF pathway)
LSVGKKKISRITLGALEDLGYAVNYTAADPYSASDIGKCAGCGRRINEQAVSPVSSHSCHHGSSYENAIIQGQTMLRKVSQHYKKQKFGSLPAGIMFTGDQEIAVAYMHEDGTLCSTIVQPKHSPTE